MESKVKEVKGKVDNTDNGAVETADKAKEVIQTLRVQLVEHQKQAEYHTTMSVKAQGALEVLLQLHPEEDNSEGK
tara:strand:+ start:315 stop:539 length:225 start_codon:yes stop_codon:yes gene_type:complete